ncbi:MAG: Cell division inhibitor, partial [uncultured Solirubrobacteraceae bacterium]
AGDGYGSHRVDRLGAGGASARARRRGDGALPRSGAGARAVRRRRDRLRLGSRWRPGSGGGVRGTRRSGASRRREHRPALDEVGQATHPRLARAGNAQRGGGNGGGGAAAARPGELVGSRLLRAARRRDARRAGDSGRRLPGPRRPRVGARSRSRGRHRRAGGQNPDRRRARRPRRRAREDASALQGGSRRA